MCAGLGGLLLKALALPTRQSALGGLLLKALALPTRQSAWSSAAPSAAARRRMKQLVLLAAHAPICAANAHACPSPCAYPGTDISPIVPALENIWTDSKGQSLASFNFRTVTSRFNELVYQYPIRIPERYSLVIRSLLTQVRTCAGAL